jgi:hypothetical protein
MVAPRKRDGIRNIVQEMTGGMPFVFVVMRYREKWGLFRTIQHVVEDSVGLRCVRADHVSASGHDLLAKVHLLIDRAEVVIAEISSDSPNVFYELGYAVASDKPILLLAEHKREVPTDLQGLELIRYGNSDPQMAQLESELADHLRSRVESDVPLLRDMLEAPTPKPAYILASPKVRSVDTDVVPDVRTFGDNLGILGLVTAFGAVFGERGEVELISGVNCSEKVLSDPHSLYFIGSPKNNPPVERILKQLQQDRAPGFHFGPAPGEDATADYQNALYRDAAEGEERVVGTVLQRAADGSILESIDYGIVIRGPHPDHPDRLVMVMAGIHSLGTGAACLAATRAPLIRDIQDRLPKKTLVAAEKATFWALVSGHNNPRDAHLYQDGVEVVEAGILGEKSVWETSSEE